MPDEEPLLEELLHEEFDELEVLLLEVLELVELDEMLEVDAPVPAYDRRKKNPPCNARRVDIAFTGPIGPGSERVTYQGLT